MITVFGTSHRLQGVQNVSWTVDDPMYLVALKNCLGGKDFIFEEASGLGPTTAQGLAVSQLGQNRYLDVDPSTEERLLQHGIGRVELPFPFDLCDPNSGGMQELLREQEERENIWLQSIQERTFDNALFICGYLHTLSMSFRLRAADYDVEAFYYLPHAQLCDKQHLR